MNVPQDLEEVKDIKTEVTDADQKFSLCTTEMENAVHLIIVKGIKNEGSLVDSELESLPVKLENVEQTTKCDVLGHECNSNLWEMRESFMSTLKYEIKSEEIDISYPSVCVEKYIELKGSSAAFIESSSDNWCDSDSKQNVKGKLQRSCNPISRELNKQWQKMEQNGTLNFKSFLTQQGKAFTCFSCDYSTNFKRSLISHMLVHDKRNKKLFSCTNCEFSTRYRQNFLRHVTGAHSERYEKNLCTGCGSHFKNKRMLDDHIIKQHQNLIGLVSSKVYNCLICNYNTTIKSHLRHHTIKIHSGNCEKYLCTCCEKHFTKKTSLDDHIIKNHQNLIDSVSNKIHNCPKCNYKTTMKSHLSSHMIKVHSGNYEKYLCTCCDKHFAEKMSLDDHIIKNHQNLMDLVSSKIHNCPSCDYKTTSTTHLRRHIVKMHSEKHLYACCEKYFSTKTSLDDHIVKNHQNMIDSVGSKVYSCPTCDYKTTKKNLLQSHTIKEHSEFYMKHLCTGCDQHFKDKRSLDGHIIKDHQNLMNLVSSKVHICPICDYETTIKSHLSNHIIKAHSGDYLKHSCTSCEKKFAKKTSLDDHIIKHHYNLINLVSSKVHNCATCSYKTTVKELLKDHTMKAHLGNYEKHACTCCEKYFAKKTALDDHIIKNHHNLMNSVSSKVHNCPTCDYKTTVKSNLTRHTMKVHSDLS